MRSAVLLGAALWALGGALAGAQEPPELHLIFTSEVRGTVGICG